MTTKEIKIQDLKNKFKNCGYLLAAEIVFFLFSFWIYSSSEKNYKELYENIVEPVSVNYAESLNNFDTLANNSWLLCFFLVFVIIFTFLGFLYLGIKYSYCRKK